MPGPADVLCVVRLDRLGRSLRELLETVDRASWQDVGEPKWRAGGGDERSRDQVGVWRGAQGSAAPAPRLRQQ